MGIRVVESLGAAPGYVPVLIGNALGQTQTVSSQEIVTELTARGYRLPAAVPISPPISPTLYTTTPAITRPQAIKKAVDYTLNLYGLALRCTRLGGCALTQYRFSDIVKRAAALATSYLQAAAVQTRTPSISPTYTTATYTRLRGAGGNISPRLSGVGRTLYGLGQADPVFQPISTQPPVISTDPAAAAGMSTWEKILMIAGMVKGGITALEAYSTARVQRERAGVTATLTAQQVKLLIDQAMLQNPTLNRSLLTAAAAGAGGRDEPKGMPSWVVPAVVGIGVVAFMSSGMFRGRRR